MPRKFHKPPTTYDEQVALLKSRGMLVADEEKAAFYLSQLNYYRLGAYWLLFEADHGSHTFSPGTTFEDVLNLYIFDRELRLLMLDAIERVEVSVRSRWAYVMAHEFGPHSHLEPCLAYDRSRWQSNVDKLKDEVSRSDEVFIRHLVATYREPLPPVWAICEIMSLGTLSHWYANLKPMAARTAISSFYGLDEKCLQSFLHHLTIVRNLCAHHSRLWNKEFTFTLKIPKNKPAGLRQQMQIGSRKIYNTLTLLLHCMDAIAPDHEWRKRIHELIATHAVPVAYMGFPENWRELPVWKGILNG